MSNQTSTFFSPPPPSGPIKPFTGTFGQKQLHHLLRRTLFGVSSADLKSFQGKTLTQVVDALLNVSATPPAPPVKSYSNVGADFYDVANNDTKNPNYNKWTGLKMGDSWVNYRTNPVEGNNADQLRRNSLKAWMAKQILEQDRTIREKMTLFLQNHLATETLDINDAIMSYNHHALLRKYALGNFKKLMYDVTLDPNMLVYLNGETNNGANTNFVNENYGRELQELFTIGKGSGSGYTEDDVKAAARVLSGWSINRRKDTPDVTKPNAMVEILDPTVPYKSFFVPSRHDIKDKQFSAFYGNKVIKGKSTVTAGTEEITELIDMIFSVDEVSKFLVRKLFVFFVYSKIDADIETNVIEPLAELFRTSKFELKPVLKALLTSDYFYKQEYIGAMVKSPVDFVIGHARQIEYKAPTDPKNYEIQYLIAESFRIRASNLGQNIGDPPDVSGWAAYYQAPLYYEVWIDSSSIQSRIGDGNIRGYSIGNTGTPAKFYEAASNSLIVNGNYSLPVDWLKLIFAMTEGNDLNVVISELCALYYPMDVTQATKDRVKARFFINAAANDLKKDAHWTTGVNALKVDINSTNVNAVAVKNKISLLFRLLFTAAEYQLH